MTMPQIYLATIVHLMTGYNEPEDELYDEANCLMHYCNKITDVPVTYNEAFHSSNSCEWQKAMQMEMNVSTENDTYIMAPKPNKPIIGERWVYLLKFHEEGKEICKSRFVAKGCTQRH